MPEREEQRQVEETPILVQVEATSKANGHVVQDFSASSINYRGDFVFVLCGCIFVFFTIILTIGNAVSTKSMLHTSNIFVVLCRKKLLNSFLFITLRSFLQLYGGGGEFGFFFPREKPAAIALHSLRCMLGVYVFPSFTQL